MFTGVSQKLNRNTERTCLPAGWQVSDTTGAKWEYHRWWPKKQITIRNKSLLHHTNSDCFQETPQRLTHDSRLGTPTYLSRKERSRVSA